MAKKGTSNHLEYRLAAVEAELASFRSMVLGDFATTKSFATPTSTTIDISVHFAKSDLDRKPYLVTFGGISRTLTTVRTAIVLVLLMDLLERSEDGYTAGDNLARVRAAILSLSPEEYAKVSDDSIRIALYRAGQFIGEEFSSSNVDGLSFALEKGFLVVRSNNQIIDPANVNVELTTSDQIVSSFIDQTLATSPLTRLRKSKALYVPGGNEGQDRLLMELLDQPYPTKQTCLFYRPTMQSFPPQLLTKMKVSPRRRQRQEIAASSYERGTLKYCEILPKKCLWDLADLTRQSRHAFYPAEFELEDIIQHLDHLIHLVRTQPSYDLVLTDAFLPFYLTTFEIEYPAGVERFVLFFQHQEVENVKQVSVFALKDDSVFFSTQDRIIKWILAHPTTIRSKKGVVVQLQSIRREVLENSRRVSSEIRANPPVDQLPYGSHSAEVNANILPRPTLS